MTGVAEIIAGKHSGYWIQIELDATALDQRITELFQHRGYIPAPTILGSAHSDLHAIQGLGTWLWSWVWPTGKQEDCPDAAPPIPDSNAKLSSRQVAVCQKIEDLQSQCKQTRAQLNELSDTIGRIQSELLQKSEKGEVLTNFQKIHIEQRLIEAFDAALLVSANQIRLSKAVCKLDTTGFPQDMGDRLIHLRQEIKLNRNRVFRSLDKLRAKDLSQQDLLKTFYRYGQGIVDLVPDKDLEEQWSPEKVSELRSIISRLENAGCVEASDLLILFSTLKEMRMHDGRMQSMCANLVSVAKDSIEKHPLMIRTLVPSLAFGIGLLTSGPTAAFIAKISASTFLDQALNDNTQLSNETTIAVAAVEAGVGALVGGVNGAVSSVSASAVNAGPAVVRDVALSGSLAYMARLTGISPLTASQVGFLGTLSIKNHVMVGAVITDIKGAYHLISDPTKLPAAIACLAKGIFTRGYAALKLGRFGELATRSVIVLTPLLGYASGWSGLLAAITLPIVGTYIVDKFFSEGRNFTGKPSLQNREFLKFVVEEYGLGKDNCGFQPLAKLLIAHIEQRGGNSEEAARSLAEFDLLQEKLSSLA